MRTIAVIGGGDSSEYDISVKSASEVKRAIEGKYDVFLIFIKGSYWYWEEPGGRYIPVDKNNFTLQLSDRRVRFDAVFIAIHGKPGENGLLQGYFDMIGLAYSSCDAFCSALTFNKQACKLYLKEFDIPMARSLMLRKGGNFNNASVADQIGYPCFVKPNDSGSSCGVSRVEKEARLNDAIEAAFKESNELLVESAMQGMEVACGVIKTRENEIILPVTEIISKNEFFDYEAKYTPGMADEITPARLPAETYKTVQDLSSRIYDHLGCKGIVRVDFIIVDNSPKFLEINSVPGMTAESIIPKQIAAYGLTTTELYTMILEDLF
ncbi:MAG TPA: D-alanine--D-alanine ligase [Bacteroidales bacterium]|nr:D-alanine--D-alanine ligase [Bacteroidales bacterium]